MAYKITLINNSDKKKSEICIEKGENLKDVLINKGILDFPCGGKGTCGKCKVKIAEKVEYKEQELKLLSKEEIDDNIHLACNINIKEDLTLYLDAKKGFSILTSTNITDININTGMEFISLKEVMNSKGNSTLSNMDILEKFLLEKGKKINKSNVNILRDLHLINDKSEEDLNLLVNNGEAIRIVRGIGKSYGVAVDIGTTTVVMYLYDLINGEYIDSFSSINPQRRFGHDVISRINYADTKEKLKELKSAIIGQLFDMINNLAKKHNIEIENINHMVVAANTTMNHILIGCDVKNFGKVPFTPGFLDILTVDGKELDFSNLDYLIVTVINNISSFVGGDLVSGIVDTNLDILDKYNLLIDIGTNGEMILGNKESISCCATAAGPAFEAANISCGVGSVEGAICKVYKSDGILKYKTIGDKEPIGICGTGLIDLIAYLIHEEIIDEVGYLEEDFVICKDKTGQDISITPKDIREVQLAKAAIRAGIDCLIENEGLSIDDLDKIFVAGGFGNYLNIDSAIKIGLIPNSKDKLAYVGNTSGSGACKVLLDNKLLKRAYRIRDNAKYIELSSSKSFMDKYVNSMYFEEI